MIFRKKYYNIIIKKKLNIIVLVLYLILKIFIKGLFFFINYLEII